MQLNPYGREVYHPVVTLNPTATGNWEASFDGGSTWVVGTDQGDGSFGWLIAGPSNTGGSPDFTVPAGKSTVSPLLRLVVGTEEIVLNGPTIDVE